MNCEDYVIEKLKSLETLNATLEEENRQLKTQVEDSSNICEVLEENVVYYQPKVESCWNISDRLKSKKLAATFIDNVIAGNEEDYKKALDYNFGYVNDEQYDYKLRFFNKIKLIKLYHDGSYYSYDFDDEEYFKNEEDAQAQLKVNMIEKFEEWNRSYRKSFEEKKDE